MTPEQYRAEAARRMTGFCYVQLVATDAIEAWHCQKPGTGNYHFDISVLRTGMAVTGDITGLLFSVGSQYGIPFLTHTDKTYVAEKLEDQSRTYRLDVPYFQEIIARQVACALADVVFTDEEWCNTHFPEGIPAWVGNSDLAQFDAVKDWLRRALVDKRLAPHINLVSELRTAVSDATSITCDSNESAITDAYRFLLDTTVLCLTDVGEYNLRVLDEELIQRLYMLEHAAAAILAIKTPPTQKACAPVTHAH